MMSMAYQHANMLAIYVLIEVQVVKEDVLQSMEDHQLDENTPPEQHAKQRNKW